MIGTPVAIEATELSKMLDGQMILGDVSLRVVESTCVILTGANGSGKTTLLRCLAGALRPDSGTVCWYGRRVSADPQSRRAVGFLSHESRLYGQLTLRENLVFAARMCDLPRPAERADQLLATSGLTEYSGRLPARVSRGQQQRLAIVRALVHDPRIVVLDEPFAGLDAAGSSWLLDLIKSQSANGRTTCIATHRPDLPSSLAARTYSLEFGRIRELNVDTEQLARTQLAVAA